MALVLERKAFETIHIGDSITITVAKTGRTRTSLKIDAPKELPIRRGELECRQGGEGKDRPGRTTT